MKDKTNFGFLMDLLHIDTPALVAKTGADRTLVSRWRTGGRKLMPDRHWVKAVTEYFFEADAKLPAPVLMEILKTYYPTEPFDTQEARYAALEQWLTGVGQMQAEYREHRNALLHFLWRKNEDVYKVRVHNPKNAGRKPKPKVTDAYTGMGSGTGADTGIYAGMDSGTGTDTGKKTGAESQHQNAPAQSSQMSLLKEAIDINRVVYGIKGIHAVAFTYFDHIARLEEPAEMVFACPDGIEILTKDPKFAEPFMDRLMKLFEMGHSMSVVVRSDFKISDMSLFSGRWLVAHLLGHVKSYYYDEFGQLGNEKMLIAVEGQMAAQAIGGADDKIYTTIHFDAPTVDRIYDQIKGYQEKSKQRFHYHLFEKPDGFLQDVVPERSTPSYLFSRLPDLCLLPHELLTEYFTLTEEQKSYALSNFPPLFSDPDSINDDVPIRHAFCENEIEEALLKTKHLCSELSAMCGHRIFMNAPMLAAQLVRIKNMLNEKKNYEVCFLPEEVFDKLTMQVASWANTAAIGWIPSGKSTACKDHYNTGALHGFCAMIWDKIPGMMKSKSAANRKLNLWIKKAKRYGILD